MKKAFLIVALAFISLMAAAQTPEKGYVYSRDTLTMQDLVADYANLNNRVDQFSGLELGGIALSTLGASVATFSSIQLANVMNETPMNEYDINEQQNKKKTFTAVAVAGGVCVVAGAIMQITGFAKLKRDRLEITPNGVIIKLKAKD